MTHDDPAREMHFTEVRLRHQDPQSGEWRESRYVMQTRNAPTFVRDSKRRLPGSIAITRAVTEGTR